MKKKDILLYALSFIISIIIVVVQFDLFKTDLSDEDIFAEYYSKIDEENNYLQNLLLQSFDINRSQNPYIPDGFHYVTGEVNNGFVIEDENNNQFVWVPCNSENLYKKDFTENPLIPVEDCWEEKSVYEKFLSSSLENGGFYVSRFETGIEDEKIVSKMNVETLVNVERADIQEKIDVMYENKDFNIEIINGYAYDRMLSWILETYNDVEIVDTEIYPDEPFYTGRYSYNNIYDIFDDMFEITVENWLDSIVYRGFSSLDIDGLTEYFDTRYTGMEEYGYKSINKTSRLVLYK